ncbi:MAG: PAS domain S-box protein, partial [Desulfobulbaceae bacterium]|nr:PAS domain S-box protein [Desulfobulbaceae bacterium]
MHGKEHIILKAISLDNYAGESQGHIFVALDISKQIAGTRSEILFFVVLSCILLLLSFLILSLGYDSLAQKILDLQVVEKVNNELENKVTERTGELEESNKALQAEKELLSVTLRSIGDAVITTDIEGKVIFLNKVAENLTGWSNEQAKGKPSTDIFQIINEKTGEKCASPVQQVLELGRIIGLVNHAALITKDGAVRSIADSGAPIRDRQSNIIGVVLVFRDVTHEKKTEEELLKIRKLESVGVLAGGIAHDFNNILTAILGNIELADFRLGKDNADVAHLLANAVKATRRATKLTAQLLTFARGG